MSGLLLGGCASSLSEQRENRSTTYVGQTTWDLYENFGVPTAATRLSQNEYVFYYHREAITRDWARMYYDYCNLSFYLKNDRVVDWEYEGNQCFLKEEEPEEMPSEDESLEGEYDDLEHDFDGVSVDDEEDEFLF